MLCLGAAEMRGGLSALYFVEKEDDDRSFWAVDDHLWHERRAPHLKIDSGERVLQHHCGRCGRDIVTVLSSGARHAAYASALCFYRLAREVTERWLREPCPGRPLAIDDEDRKRLMDEIQTFQRRSQVA
jgi:hypothetical protein